jgi:small subunit ribosomal protein S20
MPVIKSAKKKLKQDKKRQIHNDKLKNLYKSLVKEAKKTSKQTTIHDAVSAIDKAVKHRIIHKNKAARVKSALSKISSPKAPLKEKSPTVKKKTK